MIEFNGYIYGLAERYFFKKSRIVAVKIILGSLLLFLPGIIIFSISSNAFSLLGIYCLMVVIFPLCIYIPKSKKEKNAIIPKRILIEDEYIIATTDKYEDIKQISDVKAVNDFGEFYEIIFPFGKISDKFICQKKLLSKGTLEEFEQLFEGKITKKTGTQGDGSSVF